MTIDPLRSRSSLRSHALARSSNANMTRYEGRARRAVATALALVVLGTLATTATAIYEDQVGSFDWHKEHLGRVTHATFAGSNANKRAFVATEQGAVGALDYNTGEIGTRRTEPSTRIRASDSTRRSLSPLDPCQSSRKETRVQNETSLTRLIVSRLRLSPPPESNQRGATSWSPAISWTASWSPAACSCLCPAAGSTCAVGP